MTNYLSISHLQDIANIMRRDVLKMTTQAESGHPTSCLSAAEIMSVLFFHEMSYDTKNALNPDNDEFILSKGHAAPILYSALYNTGCINDNLLDLRKLNSFLEGHPIPSSKLKWIKVATGSLGQGLSVGVGMALAAKLQNRKFRTYVLLGDSEIAEGEIYEALQLGAYYKLNNIIAIVDINRLGQRGERMIGHNIALYKKRFKGFGWNILVCDGHNIKKLLKVFSKVKNSKKPSIILAKTIKGKGVGFLEDRDRWHGTALTKEQLQKALTEIPNPKMPKIIINKPKVVNVKTIDKTAKSPASKSSLINKTNYQKYQEISTREAYGNALANLALKDKTILAIDAEVSNSTKSEKVKYVKPRQFVEAFIAEQNMASMALGLSVKGFNVFASSFAAFLTRAHDQIRMAAISKADITFCGSHSGVSIGKDGASQMGLEDLPMFRDLPNSIVLYPSDAVSCNKLTKLCAGLNNIKYLRTTRAATPVIYKNTEQFKIGDFKILKQSKDDKLVLIGAGITLYEALRAYSALKNQHINSAVVDLYCIKPFNAKKLINFVKKHGNKIVIAEDHYKEGGIGEMIAEEIENAKSDIMLSHLAVQELPHSGTKDELLDKYGIDWQGYVVVAKEMVRR